MPTLRVTETNGPRIAGEILVKAAAVMPAVAVITQTHGNILLARIKANASGRPGPRIVTGDYNRSWNLRMSKHSRGVEADAGTNKVQGPRLEFGFVGADSLGRHYNQPPYPHARPAFDLVAPMYYSALASYLEALT